jgi:hypothetical protein
MYEFSVPQPIALFAYGHIGPNRDGRTLYLLWNIALDALDAIERAGEGLGLPKTALRPLRKSSMLFLNRQDVKIHANYAKSNS